MEINDTTRSVNCQQFSDFFTNFKNDTSKMFLSEACMELKQLTLGFSSKNVTEFDFARINDTLSVATGGNTKVFRDGLSTALFGFSGENGDSAPFKFTKITFEEKDTEHILIRVLEKDDEKTIYTEDGKEKPIEDFYAILKKELKADPELVKKYSFAEEDLVNEVLEKGLAGYLSYIPDIEERIEESYKNACEREQELEERLVHLSNFEGVGGGRNALVEIDKDIHVLENALDNISEDIARGESETKTGYEVLKNSARLQELEDMESDMNHIEEYINLSKKAKNILDLEARVIKLENSAVSGRRTDGDIALLKAKVENLNRQIAKFSEEQRKSEGEVIYYAEKLQELRGDIKGLVEVTASGSTDDVETEVGEYYEEFKNAKESYEERLKKVELERNALYEHIAELETRRGKIAYPVAYRKAVIDAVTLEDRMADMSALAEKEEKVIGEIVEEIKKKEEEFKKLSDKAEDLEKAAAELLAEISGDYESKEDRFNAENVERNKLYSNHIIVNEQVREIKAIEDKIKKLQESQREFQDKRAKLNDAKVEVELHKAKLNKRLRQMEDKYNERIAENLYAQQVESLNYGDRCPICDGFVIKKNAKLRFMKMDDIIADMDAIKKAIEEDDSKISRVLLKLGAYMSASASGDAYINSLEDTRQKKQDAVDAFCKESGVETPPELSDKLRKAIENQRDTNEKAEKYHDLEGRLASVLEAKGRVAFQIKKMTELELGRHQRALDDYKCSVRSAVDEYRPVMKVLGGEKGKDVYPKLMLVDKELETISDDLESARKRLSATDKEREDINKTLAIFDGRDLPIGDGGENVNVAGLGAKVIARRLKAMTDEIKKYEDEYENAKVRFVAAKRVVDNYSREKYNIEKDLLVSDESGKAVVSSDDSLRKEIDEGVKSLGMQSVEELKDVVIADDDERALEAIIAGFRGELNMLRGATSVVKETPEIDVEELKDRRKQIREAISEMYQKRATLKIGIDAADKNDRQKDEALLRLKRVRADIRELDTIKTYIEDGTLNVMSLFVRVLQDASNAAFSMTKGAYSLEFSANGIDVVDNIKEQTIPENKLTDYQKTVRYLALSSKIASVIDSIIDTDNDVFFMLNSFETDKNYAELAINFSKDRNITVVADEDIKTVLSEVL